ncbi:unnamed protein product [Rhizophagus irregularis]|nr:unnamed protein product [Rhizophagus irregularis]
MSIKSKLINTKRNWLIRQYFSLVNTQERVKTSETNPLVVLANQRASGKKNIKRKSRYKRGEVIIEWRERKDHEINDNFCYAGHITMNFYISQIRSLN